MQAIVPPLSLRAPFGSGSISLRSTETMVSAHSGNDPSRKSPCGNTARPTATSQVVEQAELLGVDLKDLVPRKTRKRRKKDGDEDYQSA